MNTFGAWYPLKFIQPAMVSSITMALGPISTLVLSWFIYKNNKINNVDRVVSFLLLIVILFISILCFANITTLTSLDPLRVFLAVISCFVVGFSTAAGNL
ncbi:hypothetical protein OQJ19_11860 [Fluoribacter gormanii]|uniref:hypothetical protein n=1 Tax=Fluoribacter gormanii TaxID=464 RepID=UPI00224494F7|nr:hypothetical protein [Fluoribacter gormanii]MCW8471341.1 hypothetical protein [Fluoribacter gormanii]